MDKRGKKVVAWFLIATKTLGPSEKSRADQRSREPPYLYVFNYIISRWALYRAVARVFALRVIIPSVVGGGSGVRLHRDVETRCRRSALASHAFIPHRARSRASYCTLASRRCRESEARAMHLLGYMNRFLVLPFSRASAVTATNYALSGSCTIA